MLGRGREGERKIGGGEESKMRGKEIKWSWRGIRGKMEGKRVGGIGWKGGGRRFGEKEIGGIMRTMVRRGEVVWGIVKRGIMRKVRRNGRGRGVGWRMG